MVPTRVFLTKGLGRHKDKLQSFELALRDAGIEKFNIVQVSSILPPHCEIVSKERGLPMLVPGQIVYCVMSRNETDEPSRLVAASVGMAVPADRNDYGYLSEYHSFGETDEIAGDYAEDMAATMLASTLGIDFDPDLAYDERKEVFKMSGKIVKTRSMTQSALGAKNKEWTTVLAAAVFVTPVFRDGQVVKILERGDHPPAQSRRSKTQRPR